MILEKIQHDLKQAMLSRDEIKLSTLRMLLSEAKNSEIAKQSQLSDEDMVGLLQKEVKIRDESKHAALTVGRADLVEKNEAERAVLMTYLPEQLSAAEVEEIVIEVIRSAGASTSADMGKVMSQLMPRVKGKADGGLVSSLVRKHLGG